MSNAHAVEESLAAMELASLVFFGLTNLVVFVRSLLTWVRARRTKDGAEHRRHCTWCTVVAAFGVAILVTAFFLPQHADTIRFAGRVALVPVHGLHTARHAWTIVRKTVVRPALVTMGQTIAVIRNWLGR